MRVFLTIDVEQDCPPFRDTYRGITEGMPILLDLLAKKDVPATFFTTGDVARRFPEVIKEVVSRGHEVGCHGDTHKRLDKIGSVDSRSEISKATRTLREFYPVSSFRAPNLKLPKECLLHLKAMNYKIDSSGAKHKNPSLMPGYMDGIMCIPVSTTSLVLRLPRIMRNFFLKRISDPAVLFVHPWEFVDLRKEKLRFDCRYKTGEKSLKALSETIDYYKQNGATFQKMEGIFL